MLPTRVVQTSRVQAQRARVRGRRRDMAPNLPTGLS
jgi:hypothetical protein